MKKISRIIPTDRANAEELMKAVSDFNMEFGTPEDQRMQEDIIASMGFKNSIYRQREIFGLVPTADGKGVALDTLRVSEPYGTLLDDEGFTVAPVSITTPVMRSLQSGGQKAYKAIIAFTRKAMKGTRYPEFMIGRKSKFGFFRNNDGSPAVFEDNTFVAHFKKYSDLYRNELLGVITLSRGMFMGTEVNIIDTPPKIVTEIADGVMMLLTKSQGEKLGLYPGCWQMRIKYPFVKGLIVVWHDDSCKPFFNLDTIKLKKKVNGETIMEPIPDTINAGQILYIGNSDSVYDIRISHQLGYVLKNDTLNTGMPWGDMPALIANAIVKSVKDKQHNQQIGEYQVNTVATEELMPDYIRFLMSAGLPKKHLMTIDQIVDAGATKEDGIKVKTAGRSITDTVLLAARPKMGKMCMFVALPAEMVGMKPGWYKPIVAAAGVHAISDHVGRVPFMAHGGGIQKIKWAGYSPLNNVVMAVVSEDRKDKVSQKIWQQIQAMGADSDGDRLILLSEQGLRMLKSAGLTIEENPEQFKAKDPYPGLTQWTQDQLAEYWAVSTPRLGNVGKGDVITRDAIDAYKAGLFGTNGWKVYMKFALFGAGEVQVGVSAPKYFFNNPYIHNAPYGARELVDLMEANNVGRGKNFYGLLWDEARAKADEYISEFLPDTHEPIEIQTGMMYQRLEWEGGFTAFHGDIRNYSPELGFDWPSYVRRAFISQLERHGIPSDTFKKGGLKNLEAQLAIKLIRSYIKAYPHRLNVWAWMLHEIFTGVAKDQVLQVVGLPFEEKED